MACLRLFRVFVPASIVLLAQSNLNRGVSPELLRYLQLSPQQASAINGLVTDWHSLLQGKTNQADQIRNQIQTETEKGQPDAATLGGHYLQLQALCKDVTAARAALLQKTRAVLTPDQLTRLQTLDEALHIMPRVIEAQRAGLLDDLIETSPIGFPSGMITVQLSFPAATPDPLPGCLPAVQVRPGTVPVLRQRRPQ